MALSSRQELIDYCLRRLGFPVIEINVDEDQISDRVDDALQFWQEYHFDGTERTYVKHKLTGSTVNLQASLASNFEVGEIITGNTSGATANVVSLDGNDISVEKSKGTFAASETITGSNTDYTATLSSDPYTKGDIENGYVTVSNNILNIVRLFKFGQIMGGKSDGLFDVDYQFALNDLYNLLSADVTYYAMTKTHMSTLEQLFRNERAIRWNRKTNKLHIDADLSETYDIGDYIVAEAYAILDPNEYTEVYDDMFLKRYATAQIKRQWGENMKKFQGIQMPGGVTLNGETIYQEAVQEIAQIEEEMQLKYELPPTLMVG
jgi:hypothetical protein